MQQDAGMMTPIIYESGLHAGHNQQDPRLRVENYAAHLAAKVHSPFKGLADAKDGQSFDPDETREIDGLSSIILV